MTEARAAASPLADLEEAAAEYRTATAAVEDVGEDRLQRVAEACRAFDRLLDRYEGRATGTGDFAAYAEFEGRVASFVDDLPDGLPERPVFEQAADRLDKRRLSESDFATAREEIQPARDLAARLDERTAARERYRDARHAVVGRRRELADRIARLEDALSFADADLDASVAGLREPVGEYNQAVADAFTDFLDEASARDVLAFVETTAAYPLVSYPSPPSTLVTYLRDHPAGSRPITTLLEYAGYTDSKLDHFVGDPAAFKEAVSANRAYLHRLGADPLTVSWPPPPADELRWRIRELLPLVDRFAPESTVARLREVRGLAGDAERYHRLRRAAVAQDALDAEERERVQRGETERELERLREAHEQLDRALDEYTER